MISSTWNELLQRGFYDCPSSSNFPPMYAILWVLVVSLLLTKPFCCVYKFVVSNQVATKLRFVIKFCERSVCLVEMLGLAQYFPHEERSNNFPMNSIVHVFSKRMLAFCHSQEKKMGLFFLCKDQDLRNLCVIITIFYLMLEHATCHKRPIHLV